MMSAFCLKIMPDYLRASILLGQSISVMQMFSNSSLFSDERQTVGKIYNDNP